MQVFLLGATGFVGSNVARALKERGHEVSGLARSPAAAAKLRSARIHVIRGDATRYDWQDAILPKFQAVVICLARLPRGEEARIVNSIVDAYKAPGRTLIFTSGTGVVALRARDGQWSDVCFAEYTPFPFEELSIRRERLPLETLVLNVGVDGFRGMVVRLPMVWGQGGSDHIPYFFRASHDHGIVPYLGAGLNVVSNVHVEDAAELFALAIEKGRDSDLYHAVCGEANFRTIAEAVSQVTGRHAKSMSLEKLQSISDPAWVSLGLAINSRTCAPKARETLGWIPRNLDLIDDIRCGSYYHMYAGGS